MNVFGNFSSMLSNGGTIRHSYMPADRLTTVPVLLPLRLWSAKVVLPLEPCPAYTVYLRLSKLANWNRHWPYSQQQHRESSITLLEASGQYLNKLWRTPDLSSSIEPDGGNNSIKKNAEWSSQEHLN